MSTAHRVKTVLATGSQQASFPYGISELLLFLFLIIKGQILTRAGPPSKSGCRWTPWLSKALIQTPTTSLLWEPWMPMASAHAAVPAIPSEPWVSSVSVLKTMNNHATVIASQSLTCLGFLSAQQRIAWDRALLRFPPAVFPRPLKVRLTTGTRTISVPRQPGKVYFCIVLGEFVVGFRSQSQGNDIANEMCGLSLSLIFWEGELILEPREGE